MTRPQAIPALTSIRGIAAWWVVLYHFREHLPSGCPEWLLALTAHGYLAVDLFFILSGFVLALNYAESLPGDLAGATGFYRLRFARIYPLHFVILCCSCSIRWRLRCSPPAAIPRLPLGLLRAEPVPGAELGLHDRAGLECSRLVN